MKQRLTTFAIRKRIEFRRLGLDFNIVRNRVHVNSAACVGCYDNPLP
jgi:hypothetical protein